MSSCIYYTSPIPIACATCIAQGDKNETNLLDFVDLSTSAHQHFNQSSSLSLRFPIFTSLAAEVLRPSYMMLGTTLRFHLFSCSILRNLYEFHEKQLRLLWNHVVFEVAKCFTFRERCFQIEFFTGGYPVGLKLSAQAELAIDMLLTCHASSTVSSLHRFSVPNLNH